MKAPLDESTIEVDMETERRIHRNLKRSAPDRMTLLVSYRLTAIPESAGIVVLKGGRICEIGTHEQLIERRGVYWGFLTLRDRGGDV